MTQRFFIAALMCLSIAILSCGDQSSSPVSDEPPQLSEAEQHLVNSQNVFGLKLFRKIVAEDTDGANISYPR